MLPKGWTEDKLQKNIRIHSGFAPKDLTLTSKGSIPYVKVEDLNNCQKYQSESREYLESGSALTPPQSLIFPKRGAAIFSNKIRISQRSLVLDTNLMGVEILNGLDIEFLYYAISHAGLHRLADTSTIPQLNNKHILPYVLARPNIEEQRRIAQILSTWDQAISATERLIANTAKHKLQLMQMLLAETSRLRGHTSDWKQYRMDELFSERVETGRDNLPLLSITRDDGVIPREDVGRKDTSNEDKGKYQRICIGDIGYNTMRMWQGVSALSSYEGIISPAYTVVVPGQLIDGKFASYLFKYQPLVFLFYRHSQGLVSDTWNLKYSNFSKIKVFIPDIKEQKAIAAIFTATDKQLKSLRSIFNNLKKEKAALMSALLTGKRRVHLEHSEVLT